MKGKLTVLVNSCDAYKDLWPAFFSLYSINWEKGKKYPIVLNCECEEYTFEGLEITCHRYLKAGKNATWGDRLYQTLKSINTEYILFLLDDFFFADRVHDEIIRECLDYMDRNKNIACFNFQKPYRGNNTISRYPRFDRRKNGDLYTLTCQPALWRRKKLMHYINRNEDAWQFEQYGSARTALYKKDEFYIIKQTEPNVFEYNFSTIDGYGVCRGKWHPQTVYLFNKYGIDIDFSKRGFLDQATTDINAIPRAKRNLDDWLIRIKFRIEQIKKNQRT